VIKIENYKNVYSKSLTVRCLCGWSDEVSLAFAKTDNCPKCSPNGSKAQHEIADWIKTLGFVVSRNISGVISQTSKFELDIFVPEKLVAIELNGIYWHSEKFKDANFHQKKTNLSNAVGIKLIHVFDDEWKNKPEIVKSLIMAKLKMLPKTTFARKTKIKQLTNTERKEFFEQNHIDGDVYAENSWGLIDDNNNVVYAISIRKPFHKSKSHMFEIARCCAKINTNVPGGIGKLLVVVKLHAKSQNITKLLTYVDTRLGGEGVGYEKAGFSKVKKISIRFWWTDFKKRYNRFKFKADKKNNLTEKQVAEANGVVKIWGCKNIVYEMDINQNNGSLVTHCPIHPES
jgi:hypothetical protein